MADGSADEAMVLAPGGTLERDYVLAQALRVLKPGAPLTAFAPKDKGGSRLRKALEAFGCDVREDARKHHRFCHTVRPEGPLGLDEAIAAGSPHLLPELGLWSQPGVFSWDRIDPGSARLLALLPKLAGRGADLGCGIGVLASQILASAAVNELTCVTTTAAPSPAPTTISTTPAPRCSGPTRASGTRRSAASISWS